MTDENRMTSQLKGKVVMLSAALAQSDQNMLMLINALKMTKLSPRQREFVQQATAQLAASKNILAKANEKEVAQKGDIHFGAFPESGDFRKTPKTLLFLWQAPGSSQRAVCGWYRGFRSVNRFAKI